MSRRLVQGVGALAATLDSLATPYAIVGGVAVVLRARARATADVDAVVRLPPGGLAGFLAGAAQRGYELAPGAEDLAAAGLVRLRPAPGSEAELPADLIVSEDAFLDSILTRATNVRVAGQDLKVATAEDLLLLKLEANRPQDLDDALALRDAFADSLDHAYLESWAAALGIVRRMRAFLARTARR
jgi:predicted nucleotidyltransferase